jgi:hypothetical protein
MTHLTASASWRLARGLAVVALVATALVSASTSTEAAAPAKGPSGVVPATGPARVPQMISLYGKGFATDTGNALVDTTSAGASFTTTKTCAADSAAAATANQIASGGVTVASPTRIVISVPQDALDDGVDAKTGLEVKKDYLLCVYAAADTKLMTSNKFTVYPAPTLAASNFIAPTSGPSVGGQTFSVAADTSMTSTPASATKSGYYAAKMSVTLGGQPVTGVKVAKDGNSFTGVTPPLPPGPADLVITTEGGSVTAVGAYTVVVGITVTPTIINPNIATIVSIKGKGFNAIKNAPNLGVAFVTGVFDQTTNPGTPCPILSVVSDKEILCTSPVGTLLPSAYNVVVTDDITSSATATYTSIVSGGSTVTVGTF